MPYKLRPKKDPMASLSSIFYFIFLIFLPLKIQTTITVQGNNEDPQKTFAFPVGSVAVDTIANTTYYAADITVDKAGVAKEFALSSFNQQTNILTPITPQTTTINITQQNQPNPLYDAGFSALAVMNIGGDSLPVVLTKDQPNQVFMFETVSSTNSSILLSTPINDAHATPTPASALSLLATDNNGHIFTCTTPQSAPFGATGSGVAVIVRGFKQENEVQVRAFQQVDATTGNINNPPIALALDVTSALVTMNNIPLNSITPTFLYWDSTLQCFYLGLNATSGAASNAGLLSVVVGYMSGHKLTLVPLVASSAFDGTNNDLLIGAQTANQTINIANIATMHTSGNSSYLMLLGNGTASTNLQIFPLIQSNNPTTQGTIASKNATEQNVFVAGAGAIPIYQNTLILEQATTPADLPLLTDPLLNIGGGINLPGQISSMYTVGDSLYVTIKNSSDPLLNGLYQTNAIIENTNGAIVGWTQWKPVIQLDTNVIFTSLNRTTNLLTLLVTDSTDIANTILYTQWITATNNNSTLAPLSDFLNLYNITNHNIMQTTAFIPAQTPSIASGSVVLFLEEQAVILSLITQTTPTGLEKQLRTADFAAVQMFTNSTISSTPDANTMVIEGSEIGTLGIPTCACIAYNSSTNDGWLVVGGTQGCIIFCTPTGKGWPLDSGIGNQFANIPIGYTSHIFLPIQNIQKVAATDGFLYILTNDTLYRAPLQPALLNTNDTPLTLVVTTQHPSFGNNELHFTTMLVSGPLVLLGTTSGLFANAPTTAIQTVTPTDNWQAITLPESAMSVKDILWISSSGYEGDCTNNQGSDVYVYTQDKANQYGRINRLYVLPTATAVNGNTISVFDDRRVETVDSQFLDFGKTYNAVAFNGNSFFAGNNSSAIQFNFNTVTIPPTLSLAAPQTVNGHNPFLGLTQWTLPVALRTSIAGLNPITGHGGWLIADIQQLYINQ